MELLSRTYGWTPDQIRKLSADDVDQYVRIIMERATIEKANALRQKGPRP